MYLRFWDTRCKGQGVNDRFWEVFQGPSFAEVVQDLVARANGGTSVADLFRGIRDGGRYGVSRRLGR